jgi:hypothetical protein
MNPDEKAKRRAHYESRSRLAFPGKFTPGAIIHAYDVGYALIEKHFDSPPVGYDQVLGMVEELLADIRPDENPEAALEEMPSVVNVLGAMIATGLLRRGLRPTWFENLRLHVQKIDWDPENGPYVEADPMRTIRDAFLEGPRGKLTAWRDEIHSALEKK